MANHKLSIEAPDTLNECILRLVDTSVYNSEISATCPRLQITPPGFSISFYVDNMTTGFTRNLTACDLKIQTQSCGTVFNPLSDGIYVIKYSVAPNDIVYVEYNHLRITKALRRIRAILCDLDISGCEPSTKVREKQRLLRDIMDDLLAAKAKVEDCGEPRKGLEIYNYCISRLDKIQCVTCK